MHGELAAELSELTPEGVEGLQILARMCLVFNNVEHVASLVLSLSYCWIVTLCVCMCVCVCACDSMYGYVIEAH